MEIEEWQQRRLHRSPKPQKKRKSSSQKGGDSDDEDEDSQEEEKIEGKATENQPKKVTESPNPTATTLAVNTNTENKPLSPKGRKKRLVSAKKEPEAPFLKAERVVKKRNLYETMRVSRELKDLNSNESDNNDNK